jgi:hypothetical protein
MRLCAAWCTGRSGHAFVEKVSTPDILSERCLAHPWLRGDGDVVSKRLRGVSMTTTSVRPIAVERLGVTQPVSLETQAPGPETTRCGNSAASRRNRARVLVALSGGRRELLEELRSEYLKRLHGASDDFEATDGLRVAEAALALIPRLDGPGAAQRRTERPRRRWWRRGPAAH